MTLPTPYYQREGITIYHGDCREILPQLPKVDLVLTDPPYGVSFSGKNTKHTKRTEGYIGGDDEKIGPLVLHEIISIGLSERAIVFPGTRLAFDYPKPAEIGGVFCPSGAGLGKWGFIGIHPILYYGQDPYLKNGKGHRPNSFQSFDTQQPNGHPCPKPLSWMRWAIKKGFSGDGGTVLDPFMGSGTTLLAAKLEGRQAIGIEIEQKYCEIAVSRLRQKVLF